MKIENAKDPAQWHQSLCCSDCHSVLTVEQDDLRVDRLEEMGGAYYVCPICDTAVPLTKYSGIPPAVVRFAQRRYEADNYAEPLPVPEVAPSPDLFEPKVGKFSRRRIVKRDEL